MRSTSTRVRWGVTVTWVTALALLAALPWWLPLGDRGEPQWAVIGPLLVLLLFGPFAVAWVWREWPERPYSRRHELGVRRRYPWPVGAALLLLFPVVVLGWNFATWHPLFLLVVLAPGALATGWSKRGPGAIDRGATALATLVALSAVLVVTGFAMLETGSLMRVLHRPWNFLWDRLNVPADRPFLPGVHVPGLDRAIREPDAWLPRFEPWALLVAVGLAGWLAAVVLGLVHAWRLHAARSAGRLLNAVVTGTALAALAMVLVVEASFDGLLLPRGGAPDPDLVLPEAVWWEPYWPLPDERLPELSVDAAGGTRAGGPRDGRVIDPEELRTWVAEVSARMRQSVDERTGLGRPDEPILLWADQSVSYADLRPTLDAIAESGIWLLQLGVNEPDSFYWEGRFAAYLSNDASLGEFLELRIEVEEYGTRLHPWLDEPWSGSGSSRSGPERRVRYRLPGGLSTHSLAALAAALETGSSAEPERLLRILPADDCTVQDIVSVIDAALGGGCSLSMFLG